jgi:hypothetical protein
VDVLSHLVTRVNDNGGPLGWDIGPLLLPLARFINLPVSTPSDLPTRTRFCSVVQLFTQRKDVSKIYDDSSIRQSLLDIVMGWTDVVPFTVSIYYITIMSVVMSILATKTMTPENQSAPEYGRSLHGCRAAALRTACGLAENLQLQPLEKTTKMDTQNVVSRLFHRYLMAFVKCLDLEKRVSPQHCDWFMFVLTLDT